MTDEGTCGCGNSGGCCGGSDEQVSDDSVGCGCTPTEESKADRLKQFGPPPDPSDPEWDVWADEVLGETEYNTELGKKLAKDAFLLARGDISSAEFHTKYQKEVMAEFGVDERPTKSAIIDRSPARSATSGKRLPRVPDPGEGYSRRDMLKAGMLTASALGIGTAANTVMAATNGNGSAGAADAGSSNDVQYGMTIDMERCIACLLCMEGCKSENNTSEAAHWMHVFRFSEDETEEMDGSLPRPCQHCSEPSCAYVCPTQARFKREEDGIVLTDYDLCIGCRYCEVGCPYGVNYFEWGEPTNDAGGFNNARVDRNGQQVGGNPPTGVMGKCTFCVHRQDQEGLQGTTACEQACPVDAISFGDLNDPESDPNRHIEEKSRSARFNLLEQFGNQPNITYIGNQPSMNARPVDGPFTPEDIGMSETRERPTLRIWGEDE